MHRQFKILHALDDGIDEMKKIFIVCALILLSLPSQVQARRLYYAEEFYLYALNLYHTNPNLERNIRFMQWALQAPFDNQVRSLALIETEHDFRRYKALFRMHVNLLIIDSYLKLATRFDKQHVYFFNLWYAEELKESFTIARYFYQISYNYWEEAKKHAESAEEIPGRISIDFWEDEQYLIQTGELDYELIIDEHLQKLEQRLETVENYLAQFEENGQES
jgi:hypothetical protein